MIKSTKDQIEAFKESLLWQDIVEELTGWSESYNREMMSITDDAADSNPSTASVLLHMGDVNGRQKAVAYMLGILDKLLSDKEYENYNKEKNNERARRT